MNEHRGHRFNVSTFPNAHRNPTPWGYKVRIYLTGGGSAERHSEYLFAVGWETEALAAAAGTSEAQRWIALHAPAERPVKVH